MSTSTATATTSARKPAGSKILLLLLVFLFPTLVTSTEIKWTPNDDAENAPLPLSMNQRQQLLQLQDAIGSSPNPDDTLVQVAEANGMSPQELVNMIGKNARDLQLDPSLAQPKTLPKTIMKLMTSLGVILSQAAKKSPQTFTILATMCFLVLYTLVALPRTGLVLSSSRGLLSKGPTTLGAPPVKYLQRLVDSPRLETRKLGIKTKKMKWDDLFLGKDGVEIHKLPRKSELTQAFTAQVSVTADALLEQFNVVDDQEEEGDDQVLQNNREEIIELLFEHAATMLSTRQLTEFVHETPLPKLRFVASGGRQKHGILVVPGLGNWSRYGLVYLQVSRQLESDLDSSLTFSTFKGGHFDGQLHVSIQKYRGKLVVRVHLVVPKKGRKINKKLASRIVQSLAESLATSSERRAQQALARRSQSSRFQGKAHRRAKERRQTRFEKEKEIEEMSIDRRRKWQRTNPDAGRYRPSGDRQRSPNNC
jgi:hypothetical protein